MNALEVYLRQIPPGLNSRDVGLLVERFEPLHIPDHTFWLEPGQRHLHLGFVESGCIRYFLEVDGTEKTFFFFTERNVFADYRALIGERPSEVYLQAIEPTDLWIFPYRDLKALYDQYPAIERAGRMLIERMLISAENRLFSHIKDLPEQRYLELMHRQPELLQRIPQQYLASFLGVTPVSLSRIKRRVFERLRGSSDQG